MRYYGAATIYLTAKRTKTAAVGAFLATLPEARAYVAGLLTGAALSGKEGYYVILEENEAGTERRVVERGTEAPDIHAERLVVAPALCDNGCARRGEVTCQCGAFVCLSCAVEHAARHSAAGSAPLVGIHH
jgi:hypothetical protein